MKEEKHAGLHLDRSFYRGTSYLANLGKTTNSKRNPNLTMWITATQIKDEFALDDPCLDWPRVGAPSRFPILTNFGSLPGFNILARPMVIRRSMGLWPLHKEVVNSGFYPWISLLGERRNTRVDTGPITEHRPVTDRAKCSELGRSLSLYYTCQCTYCIV
jgi:hypothetical protein